MENIVSALGAGAFAIAGVVLTYLLSRRRTLAQSAREDARADIDLVAAAVEAGFEADLQGLRASVRRRLRALPELIRPERAARSFYGMALVVEAVALSALGVAGLVRLGWAGTSRTEQLFGVDAAGFAGVLLVAVFAAAVIGLASLTASLPPLLRSKMIRDFLLWGDDPDDAPGVHLMAGEQLCVTGAGLTFAATALWLDDVAELVSPRVTTTAVVAGMCTLVLAQVTVGLVTRRRWKRSHALQQLRDRTDASPER